MKQLIAASLAVIIFSSAATITLGSEKPSPYEVTAKAGPWMVLAHTYKGADAKYLAERHAHYLRKEHRLPGWIVSVQKMRERDSVSKGWQNVAKDGPVKRIRLWNECAVLVGGYRTEKVALKVVSYLRHKVAPPRLTDRNGKPAYEVVFKWEKGPNGQPIQKEGVANPYNSSFVIRNPMLPKEKVVATQDPTKADPRWQKLNAREEYSLFQNRKNWTLVVQQFHGVTVLQELSLKDTILDSVGMLNHSRKLGGINANQAHELARLLRNISPRDGTRLTSYVLHTPNSSIVTVGEFDELNSPEMIQMQQRLATLRFKGAPLPKIDLPKDRQSGVMTAPIVPLNLFPQPLPMRVPRL